jgi:hypothetical protein
VKVTAQSESREGEKKAESAEQKDTTPTSDRLHQPAGRVRERISTHKKETVYSGRKKQKQKGREEERITQKKWLLLHQIHSSSGESGIANISTP